LHGLIGAPLYEERQYDHWLVHLLLLFAPAMVLAPIPMAMRSAPPVPWPSGAVGILLIATWAFLFRQHVTVLPGEVTVAVGFVELWGKRIALNQVDHIEAVQFSPLLDFGGWGTKPGRSGVWCYNVRSNIGMLLRGPKANLIIGIAHPYELAAVLQAARDRALRNL
jgi:hypothetical protein